MKTVKLTFGFALLWMLAITEVTALAAEPLHQQIDALLNRAAKGKSVAPLADDHAFARRVYLDLIGRVPSLAETRDFVRDGSKDKRAELIKKLLASDEYPRWMQAQFNSVLMERRGKDEAWDKYLVEAFAENRPWDKMVREMLRSSGSKEAVPGAAFFVTKRLESYGAQPTDYSGLTRDVGRLFLGVDLKCAECHNHLTVDDYKQEDFQGLYVVFKNSKLQRGDKRVLEEQLLTEEIKYSSVFDPTERSTGPKVPGMPEISLPEFAKGEGYLVVPNKKKKIAGVPRFSPLDALGQQLASRDNPAFTVNIVNRLWFLMMGRGLVEPLDLQNSHNPASHPELLELLSKEFVAEKMDIQWLLRQIALTEAYQRSSQIGPDQSELTPRSFLVGNEKRLLPEQVAASVLLATGPFPKSELASLKKEIVSGFVKSFAGPPKEPELEFSPSLQSALFMMNDTAVGRLLEPVEGNLVDRVTKMSDNANAVDELYESILSRLPKDEERSDAVEYLTGHKDRRQAAVANLAWSLLASTEFCTNH